MQCASLVVLSLSFVLMGVSCGEKPVVTDMGSSASTGGVTFELLSYDVRYLELTEDGETYEYPDPVLTIKVRLTNEGKKGVTYSPSHSAQQMTETSTPLLYPDPGGETEMPPSSKSPINGA